MNRRWLKNVQIYTLMLQKVASPQDKDSIYAFTFLKGTIFMIYNQSLIRFISFFMIPDFCKTRCGGKTHKRHQQGSL